jgi:DNA-binding response OmpR family regulator
MEKKTYIMVVDDEPLITKLVEAILQEAGYFVTTANNGNAALEMLEKNVPDLILLDIRMPGLDGYQVLEIIRKTSDVPVLMVTAVHEEEAVARTLDLGADNFIEKPFLPRILEARVKAALRRAGGELKYGNQKKLPDG